MRNAIFFGLWLVYYLIFWQEAAGLNLALFAILLVIGAKWHRQSWRLQSGEGYYLAAIGLSLFGVLFINSGLSIAVLIIVSFSYYSFIGGPRKSPLEHFFYAILRMFNVQQPLLVEKLGKGPKGIRGLQSFLKLVFLPLVIFLLFFMLFRAGNPIFKEWSDVFSKQFWYLFEDFSWALFWFLSLGFLLLRSVFLAQRAWPSLWTEQEFIQRGARRGKRKGLSILGLKREYRMALMVFTSLNLLLLSVNLIDIRWFWFGFEVPNQFSLKEFLHEGVAYLIASLLLAAAVVFFYFRNNLNFYPANKALKVLGQVWIIQNAILALSVCLRTYYYIDFHGIAYGRIVVLSTLVLVLFGLFLLHRKLSKYHTSATVFRRVSLFGMMLLASLSVVDWDRYISRFNLAHDRINEIDVDNYLRMHPRTYPMLYENLNRVQAQISSHQQNKRTWIHYEDIDAFKERLDQYSRSFINQEQVQGFWSWNYADASALRQLSEYQSDEKAGT